MAVNVLIGRDVVKEGPILIGVLFWNLFIGYEETHETPYSVYV